MLDTLTQEAKQLPKGVFQNLYHVLVGMQSSLANGGDGLEENKALKPLGGDVLHIKILK